MVSASAPAAAANFQPGQFFRLQNFEAHAPVIDGSPLLIEPLALTGAWVDKEKGILSMIALEIGEGMAKIYANEGACQFLFLQGNEPCETSYADRAGKYMGQRGVTLPKL